MQEGKSSKPEDEDDLENDLEDEEEGSQPKSLKTTFELNDTLYAEAELEDTDTVYLWLGVRSLHQSSGSYLINLNPRPMSCYPTRFPLPLNY